MHAYPVPTCKAYNFKRLPCARVCMESCKTWATSAHAVKSALMDSIQPAEDSSDLFHKLMLSESDPENSKTA